MKLPHDRDGSFAPIPIPKHERRFTGFGDRSIYGTEVSPDFISTLADEVMAEAIAWLNRPLEAIYPVVF